ncbi:hypothetical protein GG681_02460 [Epibacterium sp. SM1969]|uniref:Uncharacterized protein n=1 Tax=Tritonibacter aquimaris TaxID=2663379 RepID=A0A844AJI4_9RHOB|nr:hypothetical protein [Tritonibacter aquimaris]MQY41490.1 hypothetical protein [Tritonibacter aquimaris]
MTSESNDAFQRRLNRIAKENPLQTYQANPEPIVKKRSLFLRVLDVTFGLISGLLFLFCIKALRVQALGLTLEGSELLFFLDIAAAVLCSWVWNKLNDVHNLSNVISQQFGILILALGIHNLAFWAPHQMSVALSGDWVRHQQLNAEQKSIFVGVRYIRWSTEHSDYDPASFVTPKVVYRN